MKIKFNMEASKLSGYKPINFKQKRQERQKSKLQCVVRYLFFNQGKNRFLKIK